MASGNMEEISRITKKINEEVGPKPKLALEQEAKSAEQLMKDRENVARASQLVREGKMAEASAILNGDGAAPKMEPASWKCGFCGGMNTGKFCTNCGAPRS